MLFVLHLGFLDRKSRYANFSWKNMQLLSFLDSAPSSLGARGPRGGTAKSPGRDGTASCRPSGTP